MVSIFPSINDEEIHIDMEVAGKTLNDIVQLITILENSPIFADVFFKSERMEDDGLLHAAISLRYLPEMVVDEAAGKPNPEGATGEQVEEPAGDEGYGYDEAQQEEEEE
jgi:hypothetical protein